MKDNGSKPEGELDRRYVEWKGWGDRFGVSDPVENRYFQKETSDVWPSGRDARILEIGFGSGQFLRFARERGGHVVGVEINSLLMEEAKQAGFDTVAPDALGDLPAKTFDLIVAFDVLEHIEKRDIPPFLLSLKRLLKPSGRILLRFPNGDSWLGRINQNGDPTHVSEIGYLMLQYFCEETGLAIESFRAPYNRNSGAGGIKALHAIIATPFAKLIAGILHAIYFPGSPVVLSTSNIVAVVKIEGELR